MTQPDLQALLNSSEQEERDSGFEQLRRQLDSENEREEAINLLLKVFQDFIARQSVQAMLRVTRASFSAQDIAQLASVKLMRRLKDGRVELRSLPQFKVYLRTMVQRLALDRVRVRPKTGGNELAVEPAGDGSSPSAAMRVEELLSLIDGRLSEEDRLIFRLRVLESRDWLEIAEQIAPSDDQESRRRRADAIRIRLSRAMKSIQGDVQANEAD